MNIISRREFLKLVNRFLAFTGLAIIFGPIIAYFYPEGLEEVPSEPIMVAEEGNLPPGKSITVRYGRYPVIVINTTAGLKAYSAVCTHFACIVKWDEVEYMIKCPCHDGFFDPDTGDVISGPPPTPLEPINVKVVDGKIFVGGAE